MKNSYALGDLKTEIQRLSIQSSFFEPITKSVLDKTGIRKGMRCVDVGCGIGEVTRLLGKMVGKEGQVVGMDINDRYLNYCKQKNKESHVKFVKSDVTQPNFEFDESFDIVFSRFMFVHLAHKQLALNSMVKLAKKGGTIIVQEFDHAPDSWLSYPQRKSVENLRKCYVKIVKLMGGDPFVGRKLYQMFHEESLRPQLECHSPCILMGKNPYSLLGWKLAESLKPKILSLGLMNVKQYKELVSDLKKMSDDPQSFATYARVFTVTAKK